MDQIEAESYVLADLALHTATIDPETLDPEHTEFSKPSWALGFYQCMALAQFLSLDFLPVTHQNPLGDIGVGGQGLIRQRYINPTFGLAFKRLEKFPSFLNEMRISSCWQFIDHPNICALQGLAFESSRDDTTLWPSLVFEKAPFSDLQHFMTEGAGKDLNVDERLLLCRQIAQALKVAHDSRIVHGDLKPKNILVFSGTTDAYLVKLGDWGHSIFYPSPGHSAFYPGEPVPTLFSLPVSKPFSDPQLYDGKRRSFSEAIRCDIYAFGVCCFWLVYYNTPWASQCDFERQMNDAVARHIAVPIQSLAAGLVSSCTAFQTVTSILVRTLLEACLAPNVDDRPSEMTYIFEILDSGGPHSGNNDSVSSQNAGKVVAESPYLWRPEMALFRVAPAMTQLAMLDFRVREMIFDCFAELSQAVSDHGEGSFFREVSLQLAFCYKVGFGTSVNEQRCLEWITKSGRASELNLYLGNLAAQDQTYAYRRTLYHASVGEGHILPSTNPAYYLEHSLTKRLLEIQRREIQDWKSVLGRSHWLVQSTINNHIFTLQQFGRYVEAEEIARENMAALIPALGKQNAHSLRAHWVLAAACVYEGKFDEAHDLAERALAISLRTVADLGARDADLLDCLGLIYAVRGKLRLAVKVRQQALSKAREAFGDVHETTIAIMWNLRETLLEQNDYISTRKLDEQIIPILRQYFGSGHQVTLRAEVGHAELRWQMRKWGAGRFGPRLLRDIDTELFDRAKASLGESHPVTLLAMGSIAVAHQSRFKYDEAIALLTGIVDISAKNTGIHSYETRTWADLLRKFREHRKIAVLSSRMTSLRMGRWIISLGHKNVWAMQDAQHIWGPVYRSETLPDYELPDWICGTKTMILQKVPWLRGWSSPQSASVVASPVVEFARAENLTSEVDNPKLNKENTSSHASDGAYYWVQQMNPLLLRDPFDMETQQTRRHTNT